MNLEQHADKPELTVTIGGKPYDFGEIPIDALAELQVWINKNVPHPFDGLKNGKLDGLPKDVQVALAQTAREEAKDWPPQIGTAAGSAALLSKESGQILALRVGLQRFHSGISEAEAVRLYHQLGKDAAKAARKAGKPEPSERIVTRIFSVLFGMGDTVDAEVPKGQREDDDTAVIEFPGMTSTGGASASSA